MTVWFILIVSGLFLAGSGFEFAHVAEGEAQPEPPPTRSQLLTAAVIQAVLALWGLYIVFLA